MATFDLQIVGQEKDISLAPDLPSAKCQGFAANNRIVRTFQYRKLQYRFRNGSLIKKTWKTFRQEIRKTSCLAKLHEKVIALKLRIRHEASAANCNFKMLTILSASLQNEHWHTKFYPLLFIQLCLSCSAANVSFGKPPYNRDMNTEHDPVLQYPWDTVGET